MDAKRKLNATKRLTNKAIKDTKDFIEQCNEEKKWTLESTRTMKQDLMDTLQIYYNDILQYEATLPESEETEALIESYENIYHDGKTQLNRLTTKIDELENKDTAIAKQRNIELELKQKQEEKEQEMKREQLEKEYSLKLEEMKMNFEMEKARMEQRSKELRTEKELEIIKEKPARDQEVTIKDSGNVNVKLPKFELMKFDGDIFKWQEFWDCFNTAIHQQKISRIDKFNYLRSQLKNDAKDVLAGLETTEANYEIAIDLLKERYGKKQLIIKAHYAKLKEMPQSTNHYEKLRTTFDGIEKHLRSLEALGENVENNMMLSLLQTKLPRYVVTRLEEFKSSGNDWTVKGLREELKKYIAAQEVGDQLSNLIKKNDSNTKERSNIHRKERNHSSSYEHHSTGSFATGETNRKSCIYCGKHHWSDECKTYPDVNTRKGKLNGCCFNCLKKNHLIKECKSTRPCVYCKRVGNHHRSLCPQQFNVREELQHISLDEKEETGLVAVEEQVVMQTAHVELSNPENNDTKEETRLLLDSGSQRSYISQQLAEKMKLRPTQKNYLTLYTFGATKPKRIETSVVNITIIQRNGFVLEIKANVVPHVTGSIERKPIKSESLRKKLEGYDLADSVPLQTERFTVHLLIGNDYYADIVSMKRITISDGLYLLGSKFGWILSGRTKIEEETTNEIMMLTNTSSQLATQFLDFNKEDEAIIKEPNLEEFWKLETIGITEPTTATDDEKAIAQFNQSIKWVDGRYQVSWPWREENHDLPDNYKLCYGRLKSTMNRLKENPEILKKYDDTLKAQVEKKIVERVDKDSVEGDQRHYIPHHGVITPNNNTTKLRIVYDASARLKKSNNSLNECLYRGPVILEDLCSLLLRFRTNKIALVADIEKAFHQISLNEQDRDVTRFLWVKDISKPVTPANLDIFRFTRIPFGVVSSPFILASTILHHLKRENNEIASQLARDLYVDNLITGVNTEEGAIQLYRYSKKTFQDMGMNLREWVSSSNKTQRNFENEDRFKGDKIKVLGLDWHHKEDQISLNSNKTINCPGIYTKRQILKETAAVFDPLGFAIPVMLNAKLLLKELWQDQVGWDETIEDNQINRWKKIQADFQQIRDIKLPRFVGTNEGQLLCFCDASGKAYCTNVYLRYTLEDTVKVNLIFSKGRIAPSKKITIPRLELLAVLIGTRSIKFVESSLRMKITEQILWTDSQCVLQWMKSNKILSPFVQRKINKITSGGKIDFRYVSTNENPSDIGTRGMTAAELRNSQLWWNGPDWLRKKKEKWPTWNVNELNKEVLAEFMNEVKKGPKKLYEISSPVGEGQVEPNEESQEENITIKPTQQKAPFEISADQYSHNWRLLRVTAWANRFVFNARFKKKKTGQLTAEEINQARFQWIKHTQYEVIKSIAEKKKRNNMIDTLGLKLHDDGIVRCHGRFQNADIPEETKSPIFLPKRHHWTSLLIKEFHEKLFHAGVSHTLSQIRHAYWIPQGRTTIKTVLHRCGVCRKYQGGPFRMPMMSAWPREKMEKSSPFTYTGLDYLGPFFVKGNQSEAKKVWICLFTCVTIRAIHLEVVDNMTADQFLMALRRFIARRGTPKEIILDNAPQFKLTKTTVDKAWQSVITEEDVISYVAKQNIKWRFIVEFAPWMGGFYERLVGSVKSALRKTIGRKHLTKTQFKTFVTESEGIINSRPLVYVGDDINSTNAITPTDFLSINAKSGTPILTDDVGTDPDYKPERETSSEELLTIWKKGQAHLNNLWKIWKSEYLLSLRERFQTNIKAPRVQSKLAPSIGQIVHLKDDLPRGAWRMGKITKLLESKDGEVRAAKVLLPTGNEVNRPINLLYPLETAKPKDGDREKLFNEKDQSDGKENKQREDLRRPMRKAATLARQKLRSLYEDDIGIFVWCRECCEYRK